MPPAADVIGSVTYSKSVFAEMVTERAVARAFTDRGITAHCDGMLSTQET
jgi:hypothetical protein